MTDKMTMTMRGEISTGELTREFTTLTSLVLEWVYDSGLEHEVEIGIAGGTGDREIDDVSGTITDMDARAVVVGGKIAHLDEIIRIEWEVKR